MQEGFRVEFRFDQCAVAALAHHRGVRAFAENEAERIDDDGLPRTGFSRHHGEAGSDIDANFLDQREIPDQQRGEHVFPVTWVI